MVEPTDNAYPAYKWDFSDLDEFPESNVNLAESNIAELGDFTGICKKPTVDAVH